MRNRLRKSTRSCFDFGLFSKQSLIINAESFKTKSLAVFEHLMFIKWVAGLCHPVFLTGKWNHNFNFRQYSDNGCFRYMQLTIYIIAIFYTKLLFLLFYLNENFWLHNSSLVVCILSKRSGNLRFWIRFSGNRYHFEYSKLSKLCLLW